MRKILLSMALLVCLVGVGAQTAYALNVQSATPNIGFTGTFNLFGAETLGRNHFSVGFMLNYTREPLEFHNFTTGARVRGIVDYLVTTDLIGEYGIIDRLTVGLDLPLQVSNHMLLSDMTRHQTNFGIGDITVYAKYALVVQGEDPIGLAIMPFVIVPTGSASDFVGDAGVDLGAKLILDRDFGIGFIDLNVGFKGRLKEDRISVVGSTSTLDVGSELLYGLGGGIDVIGKKLQFVAEFIGSTTLNDFGGAQTSPIQINGGIRSTLLNKQLSLYLGAGGGLNASYSSPQVRVFTGATYHFPMDNGDKPATKVTEVTSLKYETILLQGVTFSTASHTLTVNSKRILDVSYAKLQKYPKEHFIVIGHTDYRGGDEYNQQLSERRAKSVADYFISKGVPAERMTHEGHGLREPLVPNDTAANMEINRRVVVRVIL